MKILNTVSVLVLFAVLNTGLLQADDGNKYIESAQSETLLVAATDETTTDAGDAESDRVISDTSIAITSQNKYIAAIMEATTHIKAARLMEILNEDTKDIIFLDIRPRSEFAETEGVPGVELNIPRNFLEVEAYEKLPDLDAPIIIISSKGIRGGLAAHTLQDMGYTNVRNLLGGLEAWNELTAENAE